MVYPIRAIFDGLPSVYITTIGTIARGVEWRIVARYEVAGARTRVLTHLGAPERLLSRNIALQAPQESTSFQSGNGAKAGSIDDGTSEVYRV